MRIILFWLNKKKPFTDISEKKKMKKATTQHVWRYQILLTMNLLFTS